MSGWATSTLGELCDISIGKTPARAERKYWGGDLPWLSIADMNRGRDLKTTKECVTEIAAAGPAGRLVAPGTLLLSFKLSVGKIGFARVPIYTNEAIAALPLKDSSRVDSGYLYWALRRTDLLRNADDAAMGKNLNKKKLASVEVPLPPIAEQRRIAAVLDQVDFLRAKRRQAAALLDDLVQSIFLEMFGDPLSVSHGALRRLGDVSTIQTGPFGSLLHKEDYVRGGVPLVNPMHIVDGDIAVDKNHSATEAKARQLHSFKLVPGDVVLGRRGEMGRCAVVRKEHGDLLCGTGSLIIRPHREEISAEFLAAIFSRPSVKRRLLEVSLGATLPNLNQKIVGDLKVFIPPRIEQDRFLDRVTAARKVKQDHLAHLTVLNDLFFSLQHRAFSGTLWDHEAAA
ncbi:restriction endonuclease subunit S [Streptomyces griseoflavus]|uniref:restriction endonuclease subunit S n=1 Tax=Streptomyces griseoflavus TaxID=35619 RepID=UPI00380F47D6